MRPNAFVQISLAVQALVLVSSCGMLIKGGVGKKIHAGQIPVAVENTGATIAAVTASEGGSINLSSNTNEIIRNVSVVIPPGALAIDTNIEVKEATDVINSETISDLGLRSVDVAGPSVAIEADDMGALTGTLQISLPYDTDGLSLTDASQFFVIGMYSEGAKSVVETFVGGDLVIGADLITVSVSHFGAYQVAKTSSDQVVEKKQAETEVTYIDKYSADISGASENSAFMIADLENLPDCDGSRISHLYYVLATSSFYACDGTAWAVVDAQGQKGDTGATGATGEKGEKGDAGETTVVIQGSSDDVPKLVYQTDLSSYGVAVGTDFGKKRGFGSNIWAEFEDGFHTLLDEPSSGVFKVRREPLYFSQADCTGKLFVEHDGLYDRQRLTYAGSDPYPYSGLEGSFWETSPQSIKRTDGSGCHNLLSVSRVNYMAFDSVFSNQGTANLLPVGDGSVAVGRSNSSTSESGGNEIYVTDGSENGTYLIKLDYQNGTPSDPQHFTVVSTGGSNPTYKVFFTAYTDTYGRELWVMDGTTDSNGRLEAVMVRDIMPGQASSSPMYLTPSGDLGLCAGGVVFRATDTAGQSSRLWCSTGVSSETTEISAAVTNPQYLVSFGSYVYFAADMEGGLATELYKLDGAGNVHLVADIAVGSNGSYPHDLIVSGEHLFFEANDGANGSEVFIYDGTNAPQIVDINSGSSGSYPWEWVALVSSGVSGSGKVAFIGTHEGQSKVMVLDGSGSLTVLDISSSYPDSLVVLDGKLYFTGSGGKVWVSDGTQSGTKVLFDIHHGRSGWPNEMAAFNGYIYISSTDSGGGDGKGTFRFQRGTDPAIDDNPANIPEDFVEVELLDGYPRPAELSTTFHVQ